MMAIYKNIDIDMANIPGTGPINMANTCQLHIYIYIITTCDYRKLSQFSTLEVQHFGAKMIELVGHDFPFRMAIFDRLPSLKLTNMAPENGWLEDDSFPFKDGLFSGANC